MKFMNSSGPRGIWPVIPAKRDYWDLSSWPSRAKSRSMVKKQQLSVSITHREAEYCEMWKPLSFECLSSKHCPSRFWELCKEGTAVSISHQENCRHCNTVLQSCYTVFATWLLRARVKI